MKRAQKQRLSVALSVALIFLATSPLDNPASYLHAAGAAIAAYWSPKVTPPAPRIPRRGVKK